MAKSKKKDDDLSPQEKFIITRGELADCMIERDEEIDLVLTAMLCRENPLLVGPPGTGKSMLLDGVMNWLVDAKKFSVVLNKTTYPEEIFGPFSISMLKQDIFKRVTTNRLPEAHGAFLDEIFKASSAILNTLLRILNERQFENGDGTFLQCPLLIVVAASNEWPDEQNGGKELGALFDRFLFRKTVRPIASLGGRNRLLWNDLQIKLSTEVTPQEIVQASKEVEQVGWTESAQDTFGQILSTLNMEGVFPGDRRIRKSVKACQAYAYLNGADEVERDHLEILRHTLWDDPKEQPEVTSKVVVKLANPVNAILTDKMLQAQEIAQKSAPAEVAAKLSEILKEVELLQDTPKKEMVLKYIKAERKASYNKIMGIA